MNFEQMGGAPEQPSKEEKIIEDNKEKIPENPERKITTPEEAAEMTQQRRKDFDLEETKEFTPEQAEELEKSIEELLNELYQYNYGSFSPKIQEEWDYAEMEVNAGKDRECAKANLERLIKILQEETKKPAD
ncbi:MAG: hypothetical protein AAB772_01140 [Patescibacteria group bacterium]